MSTLANFLTFEYANAYDYKSMRIFSEPKIYDANGDLSKRWYVYFSYRNPRTGKLERQTPIYGGANYYKTKSQRMEVLSMYRRSLLDFLKDGFNPYEDNSWRIQNQSKLKPTSVQDENVLAIKDAFDFALEIKRNIVAPSSYVNYKSKITQFCLWLEDKLSKEAKVTEISKKHVVRYLNEVLQKTSPRTRNNTRTELGSLFQVLVDNEIIPINFIHSINVVKAKPKRNKTYTLREQQKIYQYLKDNDPLLLLFVQFISYNFLRPIEVCRLKIIDVNVDEKRLYVKAKNKPVKVKIIPDIMLQLLPDLSELSSQNLLFTPEQIGGMWETKETNRRDYFSKRFKKVVKDHFNLGDEYGLYSFRHTFITKLYNEMIKKTTPFEVKSKLMLITGHSSMQALEKYLRDIDASTPEDYSTYFS